LGLKEKITKEEEEKKMEKNKIRKAKYVCEGRKEKKAMTKWEFF